jgi:hypothetical protein
VVAPECANPAKYVSWVVVDAAAPASLDMQHALVRRFAPAAELTSLKTELPTLNLAPVFTK